MLALAACAPASQGELDSSGAESSQPIDKPTGRPTTAAGGSAATVAPAGTVSLGEITPAVTPDGTAQVEMPQPGAPDLGTRMANVAVQDLAGYLGIDAAEITVVEVLPVEWRDSSLGCPTAGEGYLMVITPGFQVMLEAQGESYEYHTDEAGRFVLCQDGQLIRRGP
jgi:hypothetical protein